ncbi:hypothetical protein AALP_AA7G006700 [Arabis alpina]|uniref:cytokinin riboside 5'-monophosphate phosphoribohydrolase n=1 Tax=Arabis alpina TaxID=50452 RepID=A0A087GF64_ARAAL|nr:hypothetical protein AALP_AA7G006700 [Arabis alpina]
MFPRIVTLANLLHVDDSVDELNSYMYQTVRCCFFFSWRVYEGGLHVLGLVFVTLRISFISKSMLKGVCVKFGIFVSGGYGTMEELLEMITWSQLGIRKNTPMLIRLGLFMQVGLLNVDGYYNHLLALFNTGIEEGFIKPGARNIVVSAPTAKSSWRRWRYIKLSLPFSCSCYNSVS